jgi:hypothetical protein
MLCYTIATVRNGKIRNEPIHRSFLGYFHPVFINIQASPPRLRRTHFSKRLPLLFEKNFAERTQAFAILNAIFNCIFIYIDPFFPFARRLTHHKAMDFPMLIAAEPRPVQLSYGGSEIKEASLEVNRSRGQVGNLPHAHTSVVLESVPQSRPQPTQLLPLRCGLSCKQIC